MLQLLMGTKPVPNILTSRAPVSESYIVSSDDLILLTLLWIPQSTEY